MPEKQCKYIDGVGWRYDVEHSMLRRMRDHDYRERCIYMITMTTEDRKPLLGVLRYPQGKPEEAKVEPSALGSEVERCWASIRDFYPGVVPMALQLMPDHIHGLLFVTREQKAHLGQIVNGFKVGCNRAYRRLRLNGEAVKSPEALPRETGQSTPQKARQGEALKAGQGEALKAGQGEALEAGRGEALEAGKRPKHPEHGLLFSPGYQDSVLMGREQLDRMFAYVADNPRRLAVKRERPDLFRVVRELKVEGMVFAAIGNGWLLQRADRLQVRCHNNTTPENLRLIERQKAYFLERGMEGAVIVSPCISAGEKEIARAALDARVPLVVILENGFPPMYKPPGRYFDACADGLLLMLAPWPHHMDNRTITRQQCLELNDMALKISTEPWTQELEKKVIF